MRSLRELIDAHRKAHADDPQIHQAEGKLLLYTGHADKAVAAFKKANEGKRRFFDAEYLFALCRSGQAVKGYEESGFDSVLFLSLARQFVANQDAASLEALLKARPEGKKDTFLDRRVWEYQAELAIMNGKPDDALALFLANRKVAAEKKRKPVFGGLPDSFESTQARSEERNFAKSIASAGKGIEFYRLAAFQEEVFGVLALQYRRENDAKGLEELLKAHAEKYQRAPELPFHWAMVELMRGNPHLAEPVFRAELAKPEAPTDIKKPFVANLRLPARQGLMHAIVRQGKTIEQYRIAGSDPEAFLPLAQVCVTERAVAELDALLEAHRKANPKDPHIRSFEGEAAFLKGDYTTAWERLKDVKREDSSRLLGFFTKNDDGHSVAAYSLRDKALVSLVRLKRTDEAVRLALDWEINSPSASPIPMILAHAAAGDVKQTLRLVEAHARHHIGLADFYRNEDLGPRLRSDAMKQVRERFPESAKRR
jgi:hypothetical protein